MKVLAIGNSFSTDAMRYLHQVAKADGTELKCVNLYIGGCSLYQHFQNIRQDAKRYELEFNGENTGFLVTIKEALLNDRWDVVTMQQVSHDAPRFDTYMPYLEELSKYISYYCPNATQMLQQTWAYEEGSDRLCKELGYAHQEDMFRDVKASYQKASELLGGIGLIPSGETLQRLLKNGIRKVHRDTFHASLGLGRYALALTWYEMLTGKSCIGNTFRDFDEPISEEEIAIVQKSVSEAVSAYRRD